MGFDFQSVPKLSNAFLRFLRKRALTESTKNGTVITVTLPVRHAIPANSFQNVRVFPQLAPCQQINSGLA